MLECRRVECTPPSDMKLSIMDNRGAGGWIRLSVQVPDHVIQEHLLVDSSCGTHAFE